MCDRILVMSRGEIVGEFARARVRQGGHPARRLPRSRSTPHDPRRARPNCCCATCTLVIFLAVFLYFGLQAPRFLGARLDRQHRQAGELHRHHRRRHDLRAADRRHRPQRRLEHVPLGDGGRLPAADPGAAERLGRRRSRSSSGSLTGTVVRRRQRLLHRRAAHHAVPRDAGDAGRRARARHRDHRILRHRVPGALPRLRRLDAPRHPDADRRLRARRGRRPYRPQPHPVRPADLRRRQRPRGGAQGRHRRRPHRLRGLRHLRLLRRASAA